MTGNDLNDDLSDLIGSPLRDPAKINLPASYKPATERAFEEPCQKCRGTGQFRSYSGRSVGQCFACKGQGKFTFKTSPEARAQAGDRREAKKAATAAEKLEAFKTAQPDVFAWFDGNSFEFAVAMRRAVEQWGSLTDNQLAASRRCIDKLAQVKADKVQRAEQAQPVNVTALEQAFAKAQGSQKTLPKLYIAGIKISPAKANSANAGALYVKGGPGYLGKIQGGRFHRSRECTAEMEASVLAILADPKAAAIREGKLSGTCAICRRELTDATSIAAGIGPICATKFGW